MFHKESPSLSKYKNNIHLNMPDNNFVTRNIEPWKTLVREQLCAKAIQLHENDTNRKDEDYFVLKPSPLNFCTCHSNDGKRHFCIAPSSNLFARLITDEDYIRRVVRDFPDEFGTGDPASVLHALWKQDPNYPNIEFERFCEMVGHEQYAWIVEYDDNGVVGDKYLRLDLFRFIDNKDGKKEFRGGILHLLKHFSFQGTPLSYEQNGDDIPNIHYVLRTIIEAFFLSSWEKEVHGLKVDYVAKVPHKNYTLKAVFFKNEDAGVYFINSLHII